MKIPIMSGVYTTETADFALSYPLNLEPVATDTKIAKGYLRAAMGVKTIATGIGINRGGIDWNGSCYRVVGTRLLKVSPDNSITDCGDVGEGGPVSMDYSFSQLAINSGDRLYYYNGLTLTQVTDPDLGIVHDLIWVDGYFMTTDGTNIIVTELSDPSSVKPLKYGSAEEDPDMVTGLLRFRSEVYVFGANTIQVFGNVGGNGFPFQNRRGAGISTGCVGPRAKCLFADSFAFVGSARNEAIGVHLAGQGAATKISSRRIDDELAKVSNPGLITVESRTFRDEQRLYVHLPESSWVFCAQASAKTGEKVWYEVRTADGEYRIRDAVLSGGRWICGDHCSGAIGEITEADSRHFEQMTPWRFDCGLIYNEAKGGIVHKVELIGATGRGGEGSAALSFSNDGTTWSEQRFTGTGKPGERVKRPVWRPHRRFRNYMAMRFQGRDMALPSWTALEADIVGLGV